MFYVTDVLLCFHIPPAKRAYSYPGAREGGGYSKTKPSLERNVFTKTRRQIVNSDEVTNCYFVSKKPGPAFMTRQQVCCFVRVTSNDLFIFEKYRLKDDAMKPFLRMCPSQVGQ